MVQASSQNQSLPLPPLESGDRLTRPEFERRYNGMLHLKKAELIEVLAVLQEGLASSEHAEFVKLLSKQM